MAVYVDPLMACLRTRTWPWRQSCHLFADDVLELHLFASQMGLKREWFQNSIRLKHYDLTKRQRAVAVSLGAIQATREMLVERMRKNGLKMVEEKTGVGRG